MFSLTERRKREAELAVAEELAHEILFPESREIVASYNLDAFGDFAVDPEILARVDALHRYEYTYSPEPDDEIFTSLDNLWGMPVQELLTNPNVPRIYDYYDRAVGELFALWRKSPADPMYKFGFALSDSRNRSAVPWCALYTFIYENPAALPYVQAGITDYGVIDHAIANGIDPDLLMSVVA